jgi:hypothetical protein
MLSSRPRAGICRVGNGGFAVAHAGIDSSSQRLRPRFCRVGKGALPLGGERDVARLCPPYDHYDHENVILATTIRIDCDMRR